MLPEIVISVVASDSVPVPDTQSSSVRNKQHTVWRFTCSNIVHTLLIRLS